MVDTAWAETTLDDLETTTPAADEVADRHADVLVQNLAVSLGRIIVSKHLHRSDDAHTGRVGGNDDDALLLVRVRVRRVALAHDEVKARSGVAGATDPPLVAVDDNLVTLLSDRGADVGSVRRGDEALSHGECAGEGGKVTMLEIVMSIPPNLSARS